MLNRGRADDDIADRKLRIKAARRPAREQRVRRKLRNRGLRGGGSMNFAHAAQHE